MHGHPNQKFRLSDQLQWMCTPANVHRFPSSSNQTAVGIFLSCPKAPLLSVCLLDSLCVRVCYKSDLCLPKFSATHCRANCNQTELDELNAKNPVRTMPAKLNANNRSRPINAQSCVCLELNPVFVCIDSHWLWFPCYRVRGLSTQASPECDFLGIALAHALPRYICAHTCQRCVDKKTRKSIRFKLKYY